MTRSSCQWRRRSGSSPHCSWSSVAQSSGYVANLNIPMQLILFPDMITYLIQFLLPFRCRAQSESTAMAATLEESSTDTHWWRYVASWPSPDTSVMTSDLSICTRSRSRRCATRSCGRDTAIAGRRCPRRTTTTPTSACCSTVSAQHKSTKVTN